MAKAPAKKYFLRTTDGQKGPYSHSQMRSSIRAKTLSAHAEYREGEEGEWRPVKELADRIAAEDDKRPRKRELTEDQILPPARKPDNSPLTRVVALALFAILSLGYWLFQASNRRGALGRECHHPTDCPSGATCMLSVAPDRSIAAGGYCTLPCSDSSDCGAGFTCEDAMEVGPQGAKWDGMFKRGTRMCLRR